MARLIAKMTATSNHRVIDKLSAKKIYYAVIVSCAVVKELNNMKIVKKLVERKIIQDTYRLRDL